MNNAAATGRSEYVDRELEVGMLVQARWTNNFSAYRMKALVTKVNARSLRVKLCDAIMDGAKVLYPAGHTIVLPRLGNRTWSVNNGAWKVQS